MQGEENSNCVTFREFKVKNVMVMCLYPSSRSSFNTSHALILAQFLLSGQAFILEVKVHARVCACALCNKIKIRFLYYVSMT